jgi:hypothetical protein
MPSHPSDGSRQGYDGHVARIRSLGRTNRLKREAPMTVPTGMAAFGMDAESVMIYLAERIDPGRLPDTLQ